MLADDFHFLVGELSRLVQDHHRDKRLADIVQQGGAGETALVVLAHPEMLRKRNRKAGDKQAMAIAVGVMAADGRQPLTQGSLLDGFENLVFGFNNVSGCQRNSRRKFLEDLDHYRMLRLNAAVQSLAARGGVEPDGVGKCGVDALQNTPGIERARYRIGGGT